MSTTADTSSLQRDAARLAAMWEGEFDNTRQVKRLAAGGDIPLSERPAERLYVYRRFQHPESRGVGLYVQQHYLFEGKPGPAYRQRLYDVYPDSPRNEIVVTILGLTAADERELLDAHRRPDVIARVPRARMTTLPKGCEIHWARKGGRFVGYQRDGYCIMTSPDSGAPMKVADDLTLDEHQFTTFTRATTLNGQRLFGDRVALQLDRRGLPSAN